MASQHFSQHKSVDRVSSRNMLLAQRFRHDAMARNPVEGTSQLRRAPS